MWIFTYRALRELVLARDGYQCTFPGCDEKKDLDDHHVQWLSRYHLEWLRHGVGRPTRIMALAPADRTTPRHTWVRSLPRH
ncbi:MAG: hypothetical protein AB1486_24220 [Planctomycetota bacterium]